MCRMRKESSAKERKRLRRGSKAGNRLARMTSKVEQSRETTERGLLLLLFLLCLCLCLWPFWLLPHRRLSSGASGQTFYRLSLTTASTCSTAFAARPSSLSTLALVLSLREPDPDCDTQFSCTARLLSVSARPSLSLRTRPPRHHVRQPPRPL
jgi:hypothetical protein